MKFTMMTRFVYIIHSITPSQTEHERDFSLAGLYTALLCANISVEMLSGLFLDNINSTASGSNTPIDVFRWSLDAVAKIVDKMESNPDAFADAIYTEYI